MAEVQFAKIGLIIGSTRPARVGPQIAETIRAGFNSPRTRLQVIDLAEVGLPFLDEPRQPALGDYVHEHTRAWATTIDALDGVLLLTPQYNGGYPASLKNAIDFLYAEWNDKPVTVISYGGHRSRGGSGALQQLGEVLRVTRSNHVHPDVSIELDPSDYGPEGTLVDPVAVVAPYTKDIHAAIHRLAQASRERPAEH
ncbi:NADPH-dependent oxidoreductase [Brevibacterium permense]|uniref:NADPH-dependent FMN reductase n=1 Tax=Brevibacterium permense TaxID=234834 RepID=UPI0021D0F1F4|nr:NAD(P)H-dependent oxidoreductase [Brevibacterium permense]MCU4298791.1 NADPH-dependent oxidoreductase [Brevibacterium permense]